MSLSEDWERLGVQDLFTNHPEARTLLPAVCKAVTKQSFQNKTDSELIRLICLCGESAYAILNKKAMTKSLLFEYLSGNNVPAGGLTKPQLVEKIVNFWKDRQPAVTPTTNTVQQEPKVTINIINTHIVNTTVLQSGDQKASPLQELAEQFSSWLFERINNESLLATDLWPDVTSAIRLIDSSGSCQDLQAEGAENVLQSLFHLHREFLFLLSPNVCPTGVQGKMNSYGMVMIACCGCVYRNEQFVGVFEGAFGLLRDSFSSEVWKLKHSKLQIKSVDGNARTPQLEYCESLRDILALPDEEDKQLMSIKDVE